MNYQKIYNDICLRGQQRIPEENRYYENHHIIPRCLGGNDEDLNITILTPREHFICHLILAFKLYPTNYKLAHAIFSMSHQQSKKQKRYIPNGRLYEIIRIHSIKLMKEYKQENPSSGDKNGMFGKKHTKESKEKMSQTIKKNKRIYKHSELTKSKISETRRKKLNSGEIIPISGYSRILTEEHKQNLKLSIKRGYENGRKGSFLGLKHSDETKIKWRINRAGKQVGGKNSNAKPIKDTRTDIIYDCRKSCRADLNVSPYYFQKLIVDQILIDA